MIINFPTTYSEEEERLFRKMALLRKKRKQLLDTKTSKDQQQSAQSIALKRASTESPALKDDAKEVAKKLIKSGAIKLEVENKEKGFKRSLSRNDRRPLFMDTQKSPRILASPSPFSPTPDSPLISPTSSFTPPYKSTISPTIQQQNRFNNQNRFNFNRPNYNTQTSSGGPTNKPYLLHVKGDTMVTEEYVKTTFQNNASSVNVLSVDLKKTYAFVNVENKQAADEAIRILNGNTYENIKLSVSYARLPRFGNSFERPYQPHHHANYNQQQHQPGERNDELHNWNDTAQSRSPVKPPHTPRNLVTYDDE